jgi:hypothetical protein
MGSFVVFNKATRGTQCTRPLHGARPALHVSTIRFHSVVDHIVLQDRSFNSAAKHRNQRKPRAVV